MRSSNPYAPPGTPLPLPPSGTRPPGRPPALPGRPPALPGRVPSLLVNFFALPGAKKFTNKGYPQRVAGESASEGCDDGNLG